MNLFQWVFVPLLSLSAVWLLFRSLKRRTARRQGLLWGGLCLTGAVLIARPSLTTLMADWLGIGRGADLLVYLAVLAGLAACAYFYHRYRRLEIVVTELARKHALESARRGHVQDDTHDDA